MNASAPPPNLDDRHAATIAHLLLLLDQLLCAIGEAVRLPWYARWLVPARAMRAGGEWIGALRREIVAVGERIRNGVFNGAAEWDDSDLNSPASRDGGAARGAAQPGERGSFAGRDRETMPDGA